MSAPAFYLGQISYGDFFLGFLLYLGRNPFRLWTCQLTWSVTLLTCIQTCNITIVICGYARSFTNHITWHKYQWFFTMATFWSHSDVIEMHVRFVSPLSISFVKNSTQITSDRFPGKYYQILLDLLTIRPWRDHGSDRNTSGTLVIDFFVVVILYL